MLCSTGIEYTFLIAQYRFQFFRHPGLVSNDMTVSTRDRRNKSLVMCDQPLLMSWQMTIFPPLTWCNCCDVKRMSSLKSPYYCPYTYITYTVSHICTPMNFHSLLLSFCKQICDKRIVSYHVRMIDRVACQDTAASWQDDRVTYGIGW